MPRKDLSLSGTISDCLHQQDGLQSLVWHQARGLAEKIADVVSAASGEQSSTMDAAYAFVEAMATKKIKNRVKWEVFCDKSYFDMWAVRPVGDKFFDSPRLFHFMDMADAQQFKVLVDKSYHAVPAT